jgi:hydrogenase maturation protein HypF
MVLINAGKAARINIRGVVQGVGFRPFVYRLAHQYKLNGWVRNTSGNVEVAIEGVDGSVKGFIDDLRAKAPPLARINSIEASFRSPQGYTSFEIHPSLSQQGEYQLVSPDIATCDDCRREIFDPSDRRHRYPFTNCTNCGPRFTIIEDIPYDRPNTTMHRFRMCPRCQQEYDDPLDRRFHAQPNACPDCGPRLSLVDSNGNPVAGDDPIKAASDLIKAGSILALRGLGGFQLACDATDGGAVARLRQRKHRPSKPFAVMMATVDDIERHCTLSDGERELLQSPQSPIVLVRWKRDSSDICEAVAPGLNYLGAMLPYTPLHHLLLRETDLPLVMTSGNLSEEPIAKDNDEALQRLGPIADYFLLHDRDIFARYDDSVAMVEETPQLIRRARGYAPYPIPLPFSAKQVLACGAELKNTFCLTKDDHAFLSQHIGDMENEETLEHFGNTIELYKRLFRIEPEAIACDMHPEYLSTKYAVETAEQQGLPLTPVQHHHAHIASCLMDNGVEGPVIGVALDGTGYGTDGTVWGGEFMVADCAHFERAGHLEYVPLLGGEAAIRNPYRMSLSYIWTLLGKDYSVEDIPIANLDHSTIDVLKQQLERGVNSPPTSSAGRLFDAVSALSGVRGKVDYEAQAAVELEMLVTDGDFNGETYPYSIEEREGVRVIRLAELFAELIDEVRSDTPVSAVSLRFHHTVASMVNEMCELIANDTGIDRVALSGGVLQNRLLLRLTTKALRNQGFSVLTHRMVPTNDGGISLGQAAIANSALSLSIDKR